MPIDPNIILQARGVDIPDFGAIREQQQKIAQQKQAMQMQGVEMQQKRLDQQRQMTVRDLFTKHSASGQLDQKALMGDLYRVDPQAAMTFADSFQKQDHETWNRGYQEKLLADKNLDRREARDQRRFLAAQNNDFKQQTIDLKRQEIEAGRAKGEYLPLDAKAEVDGLAKKNANKTAIANQIDSVMGNWDKLAPDQQVAQGGQLLKILNSTEGSDAVGAEEAKRLGAKLEFATGNIFSSNPVQFGRDLGGFATQARDTAKNIRGAATMNQTRIDELMGRAPRAPQTKTEAPPNTKPDLGARVDGYVFLGGDPSNPRSWKAASPTSVAQVK